MLKTVVKEFILTLSKSTMAQPKITFSVRWAKLVPAIHLKNLTIVKLALLTAWSRIRTQISDMIPFQLLTMKHHWHHLNTWCCSLIASLPFRMMIKGTSYIQWLVSPFSGIQWK